MIQGKAEDRERSKESLEYEEYTDCEEETKSQLKSVFVCKKNRIKAEKERAVMQKKQTKALITAKKIAQKRKKQILMEEIMRKESNKGNTKQKSKLNDIRN